MDKRVEELVEWVAELIIKHGDCRIAMVVNGIIPPAYTEPGDLAKQILSHPDLALRTTDTNGDTWIIPLAKELEKDVK